jgi:hypothetical protein
MTIATLSSTESRHVKALALFEHRGQWLTVRDRHGNILGIPSQTKRGLVHWWLQTVRRATVTTFEMATATLANTRLPSALGLIARGADSEPARVVVDGLAQMASDRRLDRILGNRPLTHETNQRAAAAKYDEIFKRVEED